MEIPAHFAELSIRLSEVLDDSGAGKDTVMERRGTYLWRECIMKISEQCLGKNMECFHFGSQSEGTTIPGLKSDIDFLCSSNDVNIMRIQGDWESGRLNLLMLYDDIAYPQQHLLQLFRGYRMEPETRVFYDSQVRKDSRTVLFSAERWKQSIEHMKKDEGEATKQGPSVSWVPNWDIVHAFIVRKPLPEIHHWIERCRGKQWPPVQLLEAARVAPCFLVPAGHPDSDYKREEWRLSPNLIERMLMFSLNMTQIKCYIVLKLINKSVFAKIVGDCITSFHSKTIIFYTIERTHLSQWREHNLMFLLRLCLQVLRKWLRLGTNPHYIIERVNLFDGKLSKMQQKRLLVYIDSMIKNNLQDVFHIDIDNIGGRLQACNMRRIEQFGELGRLCLRNSISLLLKFECLKIFRTCLTSLINNIHITNTTLKQYMRFLLRYSFEYSKIIRLNTVALELIKNLYGLHHSMQSSNCLRLLNGLDGEIISRLLYSLNTDAASSRLKLASILYCSGHMHAAVRVLGDVERKYHSKVNPVCGFRYKEEDRDLQSFHYMLLGNSYTGLGEPPFAFCVKFLKQELYCTPFILLFEMNRNITEEEVAQRIPTEKGWMDSAEVDARPFFRYLQYLTYGGLGEHDNQLRALESYICDIRNRINLYHLETALNLLGHCYEMEGDYERALIIYELSLDYIGSNNAANWHVRRVMRLISGLNTI